MDFLTKHYLFFDPADPISFISSIFLYIFALFIIIYSLVYTKPELRKWSLILISLFFYYKLTGILFLVILIPVFCDFFITRQMALTKSETKRKLWMFTAVFISLGLLVYFKYTNFFIQILNSTTHHSFSTLAILIPVGISYYIFRSISYVLDVYYEKYPPATNITDYLLYMTFFPLLISGPITRAELFLPQISTTAAITKYNINRGIYFILKGVIKKAIIADYLGMYVNIVFSVNGGFTGFENLMGILGFAMQIYFDFSGYTDIAIGISSILGFDIGINFNEPFKAISITDFWRRWHISLSEWLRDYIFTPLNFYMRSLKIHGSVIAIIITFLICGIWHGASYTFIMWGLLYGIAMSWEIYSRPLISLSRKHVPSKIVSITGWFFTFAFVVSMLVLLRAESLTAALNIYFKMFTNMDLHYLPPFICVRWLYMIIILVAFLIVFISKNIKQKISASFIQSPLIIKILIFIIVSQIFIRLQSQEIQSFLYTKF